MNKEQRSMVVNVREAEIREIYDTEEAFMGSLAALLTPETLEKGVQLTFGDDRTKLDATLGVLGISERIKQGKLRLYDMQCGTVTATTHMRPNGGKHASTYEHIIQEEGLVEGLAALERAEQHHLWSTPTDSDPFGGSVSIEATISFGQFEQDEYGLPIKVIAPFMEVGSTRMDPIDTHAPSYRLTLFSTKNMHQYESAYELRDGEFREMIQV